MENADKILSFAIVAFKSALRAFPEPENPEDARYRELLRDAKSTLECFADDPLNMSLAARCSDHLRDLDNLSRDSMSQRMFGRSRANIVSISAMTRRTHYAAYYAGMWRADKTLGRAFKAWMHNGAAHGAISLFECIMQLHDSLGDTQISEETHNWLQVLDAFGEAALNDAQEFLSIADDFYPGCAASIYNRAKLDILVERDVKLACRKLLDIKPCEETCHPAELRWHIDNYESFKQGDYLMRKRIEIEEAQFLAKIEAVLEHNYKHARDLEEERGDLWVAHPKNQRAVILASICGVAAVTLLTYYGHDHVESVKGLLAMQHNVVTSHLDAMGTGGLRGDVVRDVIQTFGMGTGGL